jgi:uncharacterized membrane protein HdeD (DUF308 family)
VLAIFQIVDGALALVAGIAGLTESRGWTIARGVIGLLAGIFVLSHPALFGALAILTLVFIIAFHCIAAGILEIIVGIRERKTIEGPVWLVLSGVLSILFGLLILSGPLVAGGFLIMAVGVFAIGFGVALIVMSFQLKGLANKEHAAA